MRKVIQYGGINHACDQPGCDKEADWRARDRHGNVVASACREHKTESRQRAIVRLRTRKCTRGCGAVVAVAGPCTACMTTAELLRQRKMKGVSNG